MLKLVLVGLGAVLAAGAPLAAAPKVPTYAVVDKIAGPDGGWDLLGVDSDSHRLYVARSTAVMAVDLATGQATPALVPLNRGHGALPIPGTGRVIATNGGSDTAVVFDGATGAVVATIPTGKKPDAVAYDPATKTVWVMNAGSGDITVVDAATLAVKGTVAVGGSLELGAADGKGLLYVNVEDKNDVAVIDTRAMTLKARFPLKGCDGPTGIVYAPAAKRVLSACANGVAVVSGADGALVASLKGGPRPDGAVYDPKRDLAFVPSGGDGTLSVIKMSGTPAVLATTPTAKGARTAALDEATGRIYLPAAQYAPAVGAARPAMIPGSFTVLVVAPQ
jgi:YVTN family beta-propeller protein